MEDDALEQPALPESGDAGNTAADNTSTAGDEHLDDDLDPDSLEQTEEEEEIEVDGKKYALPKSAAEKLKSERLMHADYTKKTQEAAVERKAIAAEREAVVRQQQESQQYIDDIADVRALDNQIAQYKKVDWAALIEQDPQTAMLYQQQQRDLEAQRNEKSQSITSKQQAQALSEQQELAKQSQEAEAYLAREIPGINAERLASIEQYAATRGIDKDKFFRGVINSPVLAVVLDKARMFDELEKKQAAAKPKAPVQEKPVTRITATRASAQRDPAKMSDAEWMKHRQEQSRKR